mgnify:FL=1
MQSVFVVFVFCSSLDWMDWTGLDWTGLDWTGLDWTGLVWTGVFFKKIVLGLFYFVHALSRKMFPTLI